MTPELTAAVDDYREYVADQADDLVQRTTEFAEAVKNDDIDEAKRLFAYARAPFETIEPVAGSFGDLDPRIDSRENDAVEEQDWTGFHRIEKALWVDGSTDGMDEVADTLVDDVKELQTQAKTVELTPVDMAAGATDLLGEVSKGKITGEEDRYSHTDLYDFQANVDGSKQVFVLLKPILEQNNPQLADEISQEFDDVYAALGDYKRGDGYVSYTELTDADTKKLSQSIDALAEPLSQLAANLQS
ncbi:MAG: EfeM/EfeO family lipoprotein [Actinobacteria bacterium]|nr:EfeM/EfeO family lipoprotein [Actinomycetota bacterium]